MPFPCLAQASAAPAACFRDGARAMRRPRSWSPTLPSYPADQCPREVRLLNDLPLDDMGKIRKTEPTAASVVGGR